VSFPAESDRSTTRHYFVHESGDGVIFDRKGRVIVGRPGCQGHFLLGLLDYFLWATQRLFERGEDRYVSYLTSRISLIHDVDDKRNADYGEYYTRKSR